MMKTIIVLGGYGNFGHRIVKALSTDANLHVLVAGRDLSKSTTLCNEVGGNTQPIKLDSSSDNFTSELTNLDADILIHTAGPFQEQGYQVAESAARAGLHYIDLADGRRFVCDFPSHLNEIFKQHSVLGISGASTVPALSSAIVDELKPRFSKLITINTCIAPGHLAPRGKATLEAVLSYCGKPIEVWEHGSWHTKYGWSDLTPINFARMSTRLGALCDIPDLELFPHIYPGVENVMFNAALEISLTQRVLAMLSYLKQHGYLKMDLTKLAGFMEQSASLLNPFGSGLGGMRMTLTGLNQDGLAIQHECHITAPNSHGPEIPSMPATLLARKLALGSLQITSGAYTAAGLLTLHDFKHEFDKWGVEVILRG